MFDKLGIGSNCHKFTGVHDTPFKEKLWGNVLKKIGKGNPKSIVDAE